MSLIESNNPISESYKSIRTNIEFSNLDNNIKVIMATSAQPNEGKSTFLSNLAISFSNLENKKILLLDCDLRKPSIYKIFNISNAHGLTDILVKNESIKECINKKHGLDIITAGTIAHNPSEILASRKMKKFLESIRENYDYIFIDTPPILMFTDAEILSKISDGTILVIGCGEVDRNNVKLSKDKLDNLNVNIIGAVINKVEINNNSYDYYEQNKKKSFKIKK
ncbi:CpsD/CapB family tyrosine-protein kinase [Romboutsia timonensis]|uniref:CpsD/CapB family tyrosine-protein kinase n=1 Tax=Romboutsia timonensis TaxID=1776391 RepID=UPI002A83C340|nr:CpsD/CapB family tyrosine-protein kinase [Romboutsia timonensis]MDY3959727.1 CpsD/CapB family tyrosine-protein kinase [Romboutsia timonensis]